MTAQDQVVIVSAKRTAIGNFNGSLASTPAHKLGETVMRAVLEESKIKPEEISEVIFGQVLTASTGQNPARQASIAAGIPNIVPAWLINQVCGSGLRSIALGMQAILTGQSNIVISGGQENMSMAPHATFIRAGVKMGDTGLTDTMIKDGLWDVFNNYHMGITAENVAKEFGVSRADQDKFACGSQNKAEAAQKNGAFDDEIVKVTIPNKKGDIIFDKDEFPRHGATVESLAGLRPAFDKEGTVTAGNSSGINDGAAALILMSLKEAEKRGLKPLAKIAGFAQSGVDPKIMGIGPVSATEKVLQKCGWTIKDLDLIEANEAFAAQSVAVSRKLGFDEGKVNVNGGAIALGHPIGASGARVVTTLLHAMQKRDAKRGLATLCVGGGMGVAMCFEKV